MHPRLKDPIMSRKLFAAPCSRRPQARDHFVLGLPATPSQERPSDAGQQAGSERCSCKSDEHARIGCENGQVGYAAELGSEQDQEH